MNHSRHQRAYDLTHRQLQIEGIEYDELEDCNDRGDAVDFDIRLQGKSVAVAHFRWTSKYGFEISVEI
jgi:hypothetical protein